MPDFALPLARLIDELKKLPGVGSKSAQRLAFHILRASEDDAEGLAAAIRDVKEKLHLCSVCNNITNVDPCLYCASPTRNQRLVRRYGNHRRRSGQRRHRKSIARRHHTRPHHR